MFPITPADWAIEHRNRTVIDPPFTAASNDSGAKAVAGGSGMIVTQRDRDLGTGYDIGPRRAGPS
jgi:hypothetical protein